MENPGNKTVFKGRLCNAQTAQNTATAGIRLTGEKFRQSGSNTWSHEACLKSTSMKGKKEWDVAEKTSEKGKMDAGKRG